ncbi:acyl carrier protein [Nucisporomicrobium flavum]|uniref:acyl carrier protein n=1 Tax=Nucisporomicrobium flavum TaxID=2785915 RepID=UPI003C2FCF11
MSQLTIADLAELLRSTTGSGEKVTDYGAFAQTEFAELGYDSLALLEAASRLQREHGVTLSDLEISELHTPGELLALVQSRTVGAA